MVFDTCSSKTFKTLGQNSLFQWKLRQGIWASCKKNVQNLGVFMFFKKNVLKPLIFARILSRMMDSSKTLKNQWFLIHVHPKPLKTLGKHSLFQWKLRPGIWASSQFLNFLFTITIRMVFDTFSSKTLQNLFLFLIFKVSFSFF